MGHLSPEEGGTQIQKSREESREVLEQFQGWRRVPGYPAVNEDIPPWENRKIIDSQVPLVGGIC